METKSNQFVLKADDGYEVFVYKWEPSSDPVAIVQIAHGATEHAHRYERFAILMVSHGYVVYAPDHRGHGKTAGTVENAGSAGEDAWNNIVNDFHKLSETAKAEYPGKPLFVFGHSMGSLIAQHYIQLWGGDIAGVVLSGTFGSLGDDLEGTIVMAEQMVAAEGAEGPSMIFRGMFANFNEPFNPGQPGFEWLSRDKEEVQKYIDDPFCGHDFSNGLVADLFKGGREIWMPDNEARIPEDLPILFMSGDKDPAGGFTAAVMQLVDRYKANGLKDMVVKFYPEGRHEMLNETNRDEVHQDVLDWLAGQLG